MRDPKDVMIEHLDNAVKLLQEENRELKSDNKFFKAVVPRLMQEVARLRGCSLKAVEERPEYAAVTRRIVSACLARITT